MSSFPFAVVGAGLAGAATAWQLARRGHEVIVLERLSPANTAGSSHGSARIFRYTYPDAYWTELAVNSRAEWDELERLTETRLITPTGSLDFGVHRDPIGLARAMEKVGVDHEILTRQQAQSRWPQITLDTDVLWHAAAGVIDAEQSVNAMLDLARRHGAVIENGWPVTAVERAGGGYRVIADDGRTIEAKHVIVAAGGWLPDLLEALALPADFRASFRRLEIMQENAFHFPYREHVAPAESWPTFIHKAPWIQTYSLPGGRDAGFAGQKLAEYNGGRSIGSVARQDGEIDPANRERVIADVDKRLPGLDPEPYAETTCLFTNTPSEDFVIDGVDGLTVVSACSGHGAKFAPLVGRITAESALGNPTPTSFLVGGAR